MRRAIILILIVIFAATALSTYISRDQSTIAKSKKFSGTITAYQTDCFFDGICSITVDGKVVVIAAGFRAVGEQGKLTGVESMGDVETKIGSTAEVYAEKVDETNYTLYGSNEYYVNIK